MFFVSWLVLLILIIDKYYITCVKPETATDHATNENHIHLGDKPYVWVPGGKHYPLQNETVNVTTDPGSIISVTVTKCDIDGEFGDYLMIQTGNSTDEQHAIAFTFNLTKPYKYLFHTTEVSGSFFHNATSDSDHGRKGFEVIFNRLNEIITTTAPPTTTTIEHPTTAKGEHASIEVNVFGHKDTDYLNDELMVCFKTAILNMAVKYCSSNNIIPKENIRIENILIKHLMKCPYNWPDSDQCVETKFEIPIFLSDNSSVKGYELSAEHLQSMWDLLAEDYLPKCDLSIYNQHNINKAIKWWMILIAVVIVCFVILLCIGRKICAKHSYMQRKRRQSDTANIIPGRNNSCDSMAPHYYQSMPQLFENMYPMYKPGQETYSKPIVPKENFNQHTNRFILKREANDDEAEDAFA